MKIGFVGLGRMGEGMARNLMHAGHELLIFNRSREKTEPLAREGARVAQSVAEAARETEAIFTMVSDDQALSHVVFGDQGIASGLRPESFHISSSTISVAFSRRLSDEHKQRGQGYLTACVFGRPEAAENRKLIVIPAGDNAAVEKFRPLFDVIGRRTLVVGREPWHGNGVKLCGNFMIASMVETFGEAFATLGKAGINEHLFFEVMRELWGSPVYNNYGSTILEKRFDPAGFALKLGFKDVRQVLEFAQEVFAPMPVASILRDQLVSAIANGQGDLDWCSVAQIAARNAGLCK